MEPLAHYLVELHEPPSGWQALQQLAARARASAEGLNAEGTRVRFLRSIFVPEEDTCFFLYEGASADAVGEAGRRAALAVERVDAAVQLETGDGAHVATHQGLARPVAHRPNKGVSTDETEEL